GGGGGAGGGDVTQDGAAGGAVVRGGGGRGKEPLAERAALVRLDVAEGDPAQPPRIHHARHRLGDGGKERALPAMEEERLRGIHEELVEGKAARADRGQEGGKAINARGDLVDFRLHGNPPV